MRSIVLKNPDDAGFLIGFRRQPNQLLVSRARRGVHPRMPTNGGQEDASVFRSTMVGSDGADTNRRGRWTALPSGCSSWALVSMVAGKKAGSRREVEDDPLWAQRLLLWRGACHARGKAVNEKCEA